MAQIEIGSSDHTEFAWIKLLLSCFRAILLFAVWSVAAPRGWRCWRNLVAPGGGEGRGEGGGNAFSIEPAALAPLLNSRENKINVCAWCKWPSSPLAAFGGGARDQPLPHKFQRPNRKPKFAKIRETLLSQPIFRIEFLCGENKV